MGWIAAGVAAASAIGNAVTRDDEGEPTIGSETGAGWTGDKDGKTMQPSFPRANEFLGSNIGRAAAGVGESYFDDYRGRRNTRLNHEFLQSKGLNSFEIAGGGSGGPIGATGSTLGSGPATQVQSQQNFVAGQAQLDRENREKVARIGAAAPGRQAGVAEERQGLASEIAPLQRAKITKEIERISLEMERTKFELQNYWPILFAKMGPDNVKVALAMFNSGLSMEEVLMGQGDIGPKKKREVEELYNILLKITGGSGGAVGWMQLMKQMMKGEGTLNSGKREFLEGFLEGQGGNPKRLERDPREGRGAYGGGPGPMGRRATDR